jgi:hypothetical protein
MEQQKPGRNDPCPCGSGKKYKKCHGATESAGGDAIGVTANDPGKPKVGPRSVAIKLELPDE